MQNKRDSKCVKIKQDTKCAKQDNKCAKINKTSVLSQDGKCAKQNKQDSKCAKIKQDSVCAKQKTNKT